MVLPVPLPMSSFMEVTETENIKSLRWWMYVTLAVQALLAILRLSSGDLPIAIIDLLVAYMGWVVTREIIPCFLVLYALVVGMLIIINISDMLLDLQRFGFLFDKHWPIRRNIGQACQIASVCVTTVSVAMAVKIYLVIAPSDSDMNPGGAIADPTMQAGVDSTMVQSMTDTLQPHDDGALEPFSGPGFRLSHGSLDTARQSVLSATQHLEAELKRESLRAVPEDGGEESEPSYPPSTFHSPRS